MKKTFSLQHPTKAPARVLDIVKHEVNKYVRREHQKKLPEGFDSLSFACRVGATAETATECTLRDVAARIDQVANSGSTQIHVEIVARPVARPARSSR